MKMRAVIQGLEDTSEVWLGNIFRDGPPKRFWQKSTQQSFGIQFGLFGEGHRRIWCALDRWHARDLRQRTALQIIE